MAVRLFVVALLLFGSSCVDQIDFTPAEETGTLVVDGAIVAPNNFQFVELSRTDVLGKKVFPPEEGANITLFDDLGNSEVYSDLGDGRYVVSNQFVEARVGRSYHIEITLANGKIYRSDPETILPTVPIDRLYYETIVEPITTDENKVVDRAVFNVFADATFSQDEDNPYLRYQVKHSFLVSEIVCSPLHQLKACFVARDVQRNGILLLDGSRLSPGAKTTRQVASTVIDYAFGAVAGFRVSQQSLSRRAYDYWTDLNLVINNVGTVFDAPPAAILGNIKCVDDENEEVLGFFGAYEESGKSIIVRGGELDEEFRQLPLCGLPGLPPPMRDAACCDCLRLDGSSTQRPDWWPQ